MSAAVDPTDTGKKSWDWSSICLRTACVLTFGIGGYHAKESIQYYEAKDQGNFIIAVTLAAAAGLASLLILFGSCSCCQLNNILAATRKVTRRVDEVNRIGGELKISLNGSIANLDEAKLTSEEFKQAIKDLKLAMDEFRQRLDNNQLYLQLTNTISDESHKNISEMKTLQAALGLISALSQQQDTVLQRIETCFNRCAQILSGQEEPLEELV